MGLESRNIIRQDPTQFWANPRNLINNLNDDKVVGNIYNQPTNTKINYICRQFTTLGNTWICWYLQFEWVVVHSTDMMKNNTYEAFDSSI